MGMESLTQFAEQVIVRYDRHFRIDLALRCRQLIIQFKARYEPGIVLRTEQHKVFVTVSGYKYRCALAPAEFSDFVKIALAF